MPVYPAALRFTRDSTGITPFNFPEADLGRGPRMRSLQFVGVINPVSAAMSNSPVFSCSHHPWLTAATLWYTTPVARPEPQQRNSD